MAWLVLLSLCSSFAITSAAGTWIQVHNEHQAKLACTKLNRAATRSPRYDDVYTTLEQCQSACLTQVPLCNAVNYVPASRLKAKRGRCQFEYCEKGYKYAQIKGFLSYINFGSDGNPTLPGNWMKVRDATQPKLACEKLNKGSGAPSPKYDSVYANVKDCKRACLTQVLGCNAVNFSPKEDKQVVKFGVCQFESCKNDYKVGGTKHYNSYIFSGYSLAKSTTTTTGLWTKLQLSNKKFDCEHKNSAATATPRYGSVYGSLAGCQHACATKVASCNAVNYAPTNVHVRARRGKCEFLFCNFRETVRYEDTNSFQGYRFNGNPLRPTQPPTRSPITNKPIDYDRDGWGLAGDPREPQLDCKKLNNDRNHDPRSGAKYGTKYPGGVSQCKVACEKVTGCDAINYNKDDGGTCQFQQCNGRVARGTNRGFSSYLYLRPRAQTTARRVTEYTTTPRYDPQNRKTITGCQSTCISKLTCDDVMAHHGTTCSDLEHTFRGCSCTGCRCHRSHGIRTTPVTCDGSTIGNSAQHTSERDAHASTGYEAPGQPVGTRLSFPCRQGYESGLVTYTCGGDGKFHTSDKCTKVKTTPGPWGVWHAYEPSGCPTACGSGSGLVGDVRCSTDRCDLRTKPKPKRCEVVKCLQPCKMTRLISLAGSGVGCTMAMLGIGDPCDCLCNFALAKIQPLASCTMGTSNVDIHDQWRACAVKRRGCGQDSGVVVVHGRRLRTAWTEKL